MATRFSKLEKLFPDRKIYQIILDRPDKLNALSRDMIQTLIADFQEAHRLSKSEEILCLIVGSSSEPKAFCAGADLSERMLMSEVEVSETLKDLRTLMDSCAQFPFPTIAAIHGIAFGGGLELALACDMRISSPGSMMGLTETRLGIIPGAGGTQRLSRLVGLAKAKELIFSGKRISAIEAEKIELVNFLADDPSDAARKFAVEITEGGPLALLSAKKAIDEGLGLTLERALDLERTCYQKVLDSEDRLEGLKAFVEKRKPRFLGK